MGDTKCANFIGGESDEVILEIDGSAVTTTLSSTGLVKGQHLAKVKKGTASDSNLVTIVLNRPFGLPPSPLYPGITVDLTCRDDAAPTRDTITVRTLELDGTTVEDDADFRVVLKGTRGIREGAYY